MSENRDAGLRTTPEMTEEQRRLLTKNYFTVNKAEMLPYTHYLMIIAYISFAIGIIFIVYLNTKFFTIVIGALCIFNGFLSIRKWKAPYKAQKKKYDELPTSQQLDEWLLQDINNIVKPKAIKDLSLDMSRLKPENFIVVPLPIYWTGGGAADESLKRKKSSEGHYKYSVYKINVLALTEHYISFYSCVYDWLENAIKSSNTDEFFYDDISTIKNDAEKTTFKIFGTEKDEKSNFLTAKIFRIRNMSGEILTVLTNIAELEHTPKIATNLNEVIQVLRIILRNRRYGEVHEISQPPKAAEVPKDEHH